MQVFVPKACLLCGQLPEQICTPPPTRQVGHHRARNRTCLIYSIKEYGSKTANLSETFVFQSIDWKEICHTSVFDAISREKIREQFDVNLFGLMDVTRALLPHFRRNKAVERTN
jgi:hypothetical protein